VPAVPLPLVFPPVLDAVAPDVPDALVADPVEAAVPLELTPLAPEEEEELSVAAEAMPLVAPVEDAPLKPAVVVPEEPTEVELLGEVVAAAVLPVVPRVAEPVAMPASESATWTVVLQAMRGIRMANWRTRMTPPARLTSSYRERRSIPSCGRLLLSVGGAR
jgi:hypothetical protein